MKSITVRQAKYLVDRYNRNELPNMLIKHKQIFDDVYVQIVGDELEGVKGSYLFEKIGEQIETEAKRLIEELKPKSIEISNKINQLSKEYGEIAKKKTEKNAKATEEKLLAKKKELDEAAQSYDKLYEDAQKALDEYKIKVITEDNRGVRLMDIHDKEYKVIDYYIHWTIDESKEESKADKYESTVDDLNK